jgi:hypothetical protein
MKDNIEFEERIERKAVTIVLVLVFLVSAVMAIACSIDRFHR